MLLKLIFLSGVRILIKLSILLCKFDQLQISKKYYTFAVLIVIGLITFTGALAGCNKYKIFENTEGFNHFSFACPDRFILDEINIRETIRGKTTNVYFIQSDKEQQQDLLLLQIFILEKTELYPDYQVRLEYTISHPVNKNNFQLLTREEIMVSNIKGEKIVYFYDIGSSKSLLEIIGVEVYFSDQEYNWEIKLTSSSENQEVIIDEFNHIIETFKILD
jgi:hypothetical protein